MHDVLLVGSLARALKYIADWCVIVAEYNNGNINSININIDNVIQAGNKYSAKALCRMVLVRAVCAYGFDILSYCITQTRRQSARARMQLNV